MNEGQFTFIQTFTGQMVTIVLAFQTKPHTTGAVEQNPFHLDQINHYLPYSKQSEESAVA